MTLTLTIKKGGKGSGFRGHSGLPGVHGGSRPRGSGFVTVFHGTQDEFIEDIQETGLYVGNPHFGRPPAVYFIETKEDAFLTGRKFLRQHYESNRSPDMEVLEAGDKNFAIIELHIPRKIYKSKFKDEEHDTDFGTTTAGYITQDFPPEWIKAIRIYAIDELEHAYWDEDEAYVRAVWSEPILVHEVTKEDTVIVYVVQLIESKKDTKNKEFVEKQLPIDAKSKENIFIVRRNIFFDDTDTLAEKLFTGEISIGEWQETFKDTMRQYYSSSAAIGKGGWDEMSFADWGRLGPVMKDQYQYLQGFAEHISENRDTVSLKYIKARSKLYGEGAGFPASLMEAGVVFEALLPYIPRDGTTECLNRCHCSWVNEIVRKEGAWNIVVSTWLLGVADHCLTCIARDGHVEQNRVHETVVIPEVIGGY